jgi:hypothetical protein
MHKSPDSGKLSRKDLDDIIDLAKKMEQAGLSG